jgi:rod shape-determining protein MreC
MQQPKRRIHLKMAMILFLAILLLFIDKQLNGLERIKSTLAFVTHPILVFVHELQALSPAHAQSAQSPSSPASNPSASDRLSSDVRDIRLNLDLALLEENTELRALLKLAQHASLTDFNTARIISQTPHTHHQSFLVDQGMNDGIHLGQGVIHPQGVVGQVVEVSLTASRVMALTDSRHQLLVENQRNGERALVKGSGGELELLYVQPDRDFQVGDLFITTGLDGLFPAGLHVGRIQRMLAPVKSEFSMIRLTPSVQLGQLDHLLIVKLPRP